MERPRQTAYEVGHVAATELVDRDARDAMLSYLTIDLGRDRQFAEARAEEEVERKIAKATLRGLASSGIKVNGLDVLDLGSGLGAMSEELTLNGANVIALEPGAAWAELTRRRAERHGGKFQLKQAVGEAIPLADRSVDLVVSLQVLEHVTVPKQVLSEVWRVLRPGGHFYLACENYLAFREGHYGVCWLPLLPKSLGALYLRMRGRDPTFLRESVTYVTYPGILRMCAALGFVRRRDALLLQNLQKKGGVTGRALRVAAALGGSGLLCWLNGARRTFTFGVYELFDKPGNASDRASP